MRGRRAAGRRVMMSAGARGSARVGGASIAALSLALCAAAPAAAQVGRTQQAVPTPQQLQPADQLPAAKEARRRADIFQAPDPGPCPLRDSDLTFTLTSVTFTGAEKLDLKRLARAYDGDIGKTLPVSAICDIRDRASALLFSRGILARVEIPEQKIADGKLTLEVIQARVASVRFHGDGGPSQARVEAILERLRGMAPFDLDVAQRYLLLAADIPGVQLSAAIRPSAAGRGAVDLDVTVSRREIEAAVNLQNYGSKTLGREAALARVDLNGITPFGDRTSLIAYSTFDLREQKVVQLLEDLRPFDDGIVLHGSVSYAKTKPGAALSPLGLNGDSLAAELSVGYPLIRKRNLNLNLLGGFDYVDEKTDFGNNGGTLIDDKLRVLFARAQADNAGAVFGLAYNAGLVLELRKGLDALGASQKGSSALSRSEGEADAFVARLDARLRVQPQAATWLVLVGEVTAQDADRPLLTYEELSVGNLTIGRGYDPSSVAGDRGIAASGEARFGPWVPRRWVQITPYAFYDVAYAKYLDTLGDSVTVHSAGGGLRFSFALPPRVLAKSVEVDVAYVHPFDKPSAAAAAPPTSRVLANLTVRY